jgi:oligopeptidase B
VHKLLTDDYAWLRDKENPEVTAYLEAENAYAEAWMAPLAGLREDLYKEMLSHIKQTDVSVPFRDGRLVVLHAHRGGPAVRHHLPQSSGSAAAQDARRNKSFSTATSSPRATPSFLSAQPTSPTTAAGWPTPRTPPASASTPCTSRTSKPARPARRSRARRLRSLGGRQSAPSSIPSKTKSKSASTSLWRTLGTPHSADVLVYQDDDERFNLGAGRTRDGKFIVLESASHTTSESHGAAAPTTLKPHSPSSARVRTITNTPSTIATACGSSAPTTRPQLPPRHSARIHAKPRTLDRAHPPSRRVMLEDVDLFARLLLLPASAKTACPACASIASRARTRSRPAGEIAFPEPAYSAHPHINRIFDTTHLPLRLPVPGHAQLSLRVRRGHRRIHASEAA